jgi:hypothetical protein
LHSKCGKSLLLNEIPEVWSDSLTGDRVPPGSQASNRLTGQAAWLSFLRNWAEPTPSLRNWPSGATPGNRRKQIIFILGVRQLLRGTTCPSPNIHLRSWLVFLVSREGWSDSNPGYRKQFICRPQEIGFHSEEHREAGTMAGKRTNCPIHPHCGSSCGQKAGRR